MEKKYYTPKLQEFHPGFEYEYQSGVEGEEFESTIFTTFSANEIHSWVDTCKDIPDCMAPIFYRVKYLDQEDIESLIHINNKNFSTKLKLRTSNENELVFQTYWIETNEYLDEEYIYWNIKYNQIKITHKSKTLFWGKIKNKSVLEQILKMII